jgi:formate hydrogenlyase subunit 6/NADH:ubiquinone oxidoreductase subunit I
MACIQWCPSEAINFTDKAAKRKRYRHPDIKFADITG